MFGEVIDLRWGDCDAVARDGRVIVPEQLQSPLTQSSHALMSLVLRMTHFLMGPSFSNAIKLTARLGSD